jgi:hypothetical protein
MLIMRIQAQCESCIGVPVKLTELAWSWQQIAITLIWKLKPQGLVLFPQDLSLPRDRVMLEERLQDRINLTFITLKEATMRTHAKPAQRATTDKLSGRWQQIAAVMLWKLAKKGVTLTEMDRSGVPAGLELLTSGHPDGVEWRFLPKRDALKMAIHGEISQERAS